MIPSAAWKRATYSKDPTWHLGETLSAAIGQGAVSVNALQLCVAAARIANGRKALMPRLIKSVGGIERPSGAAVPDLPFLPEHLDTVRAGMAAVANDTSGSAYRQSQLGLGDVLMAGKTGSAQVRSFDNVKSRKNTGLPWKLKDHNLFIAFAPFDAPRYALSVIVQHGGLSGALSAAPKAREIMRTVLLKDPEIRARIQRPLPMPEMDPQDVVDGAAPGDPETIVPTAANRPGNPL